MFVIFFATQYLFLFHVILIFCPDQNSCTNFVPLILLILMERTHCSLGVTLYLEMSSLITVPQSHYCFVVLLRLQEVSQQVFKISMFSTHAYTAHSITISPLFCFHNYKLGFSQMEKGSTHWFLVRHQCEPQHHLSGLIYVASQHFLSFFHFKAHPDLCSQRNAHRGHPHTLCFGSHHNL